MKKFVICTTILLLSSVLTYAIPSADTIVSKTSESVLNAIPDSVQSTFNTIYSDFKSGLMAIGSALKVGSEHVYKVLIKQQFVYSITYLIIYITLIICICMMFKGKEKPNFDFIDWNITATKFIIGCAISLLLIILLCHTLSLVITGFVNPEYGAIQEISNLIIK